MSIYTGYYPSPIGYLEITASESGVQSVVFVDETRLPRHENEHVVKCIEQLDEYFKGLRDTFTVTLQPTGTEFQRGVWAKLQEIPPGTTVTYAGLATALGNSQAARAVGSANGKNRIAILIPCHRVVGKNHALTGFAWGTWRKEWLLQHEKKQSGESSSE